MPDLATLLELLPWEGPCACVHTAGNTSAETGDAEKWLWKGSLHLSFLYLLNKEKVTLLSLEKEYSLGHDFCSL